jgi:hypothetical protein
MTNTKLTILGVLALAFGWSIWYWNMTYMWAQENIAYPPPCVNAGDCQGEIGSAASTTANTEINATIILSTKQELMRLPDCGLESVIQQESGIPCEQSFSPDETDIYWPGAQN